MSFERARRDAQNQNETLQFSNSPENTIKGLPSNRLFKCPDSIGGGFLCQRYTPDWVKQKDTRQLLKERMIKIR